MRLPVSTGVLLAACAAGCGDDGRSIETGPIDGIECTAGTVTPGGKVAGAVTATSCVKFDEGFHRNVLAESWTLQAEPATAYVIRLDPEGTSASLRLVAAARGSDGAVHFAAGYAGEFREHDEPLTDDFSQEMVIPSTGVIEFAIRVTAFDTADVGSYELRVLSCPLSTLSVGGLPRRVDLTTSCQLLAPNFDPDSVRAALFTFRAEEAGSYRVDVGRRGGDGLLRGLIAGPGTDIGAWLPTGTWEPVGPDTGISRTLDLPTPGRYTIIVASPVDTNAVFDVGVSRPVSLRQDRR